MKKGKSCQDGSGWTKAATGYMGQDREDATVTKPYIRDFIPVSLHRRFLRKIEVRFFNFKTGTSNTLDRLADMLIILVMKSKQKGEIYMPNDQAMEELKRRVRDRGSQSAVAEELGITPAYLNDILKGRRDLSDNVLYKLGFVKISLHVKTKQATQVIKAITSELESTAE